MFFSFVCSLMILKKLLRWIFPNFSLQCCDMWFLWHRLLRHNFFVKCSYPPIFKGSLMFIAQSTFLRRVLNVQGPCHSTKHNFQPVLRSASLLIKSHGFFYCRRAGSQEAPPLPACLRLASACHTNRFPASQHFLLSCTTRDKTFIDTLAEPS